MWSPVALCLLRVTVTLQHSLYYFPLYPPPQHLQHLQHLHLQPLAWPLQRYSVIQPRGSDKTNTNVRENIGEVVEDNEEREEGQEEVAVLQQTTDGLSDDTPLCRAEWCRPDFNQDIAEEEELEEEQVEGTTDGLPDFTIVCRAEWCTTAASPGLDIEAELFNIPDEPVFSVQSHKKPQP